MSNMPNSLLGMNRTIKPSVKTVVDAEKQGLKNGYIDPLGSGLLKALFLKSPAMMMAKSGAKKVKDVTMRKRLVK